VKLALVLALAACKPHVTSCDDDLTGAWSVDGKTWNVVDDLAAPEAYPTFADVPAASAGIVVAPRVIELARAQHRLDGEVHRRFMQADQACVSRAPAHVVACHDDTLEIVVGDPSEPITYAPCAWAGVAPTHRELWKR
jgi:hypothetical protein